MANSDSSAIVRFVQHVQAEPILDTQRPVIHDTVPTELAEPPRPHSLRSYFVTGLIASALGIGGAFYLAETGSPQATTSARGGLAGVSKPDNAKAQLVTASEAPLPEPTAAPTALPAVEPPDAPVSALTPTAEALASEEAEEAEASEAAPTVSAEPASEAAPSVSAEPASQAAPSVQADAATEAVAAVAAPAPAKAAAKKTKANRRAKKARKAPRAKKAKKSVAVAKDGKGTLMLGAKPPCRIYIDGRDTGKTTPQRGISLSAGKHKVLLRNREYNIESRATVIIEAGKTSRVIRDLSKQIK